MPRVKIEIRKGRTEEHKQKLLQAVHDALVEAIKIPEHDRIQTLYEHEEQNFEVSTGKTEMFTLIEIIMFPGRSIEAKRNLYTAIVRNLEQLGIEVRDIMIIYKSLLWKTGGYWGSRQVK